MHLTIRDFFLFTGARARAKRATPNPPDPVTSSLFSEGGEVITLQTEGSLMIPRTGIKRYNYVNTKK